MGESCVVSEGLQGSFSTGKGVKRPLQVASRALLGVRGAFGGISGYFGGLFIRFRGFWRVSSALQKRGGFRGFFGGISEDFQGVPESLLGFFFGVFNGSQVLLHEVQGSSMGCLVAFKCILKNLQWR